MAHQQLPTEASMPDLYRRWLLWLPAAEDKSDETVRAYGQGLRRLLMYAKLDRLRPEDLTQVLLTDTVRVMRADRRPDRSGEPVPAVSKATLNQTLAAVNSFFDFCLAERLLSEVPDLRRIRKLTKLDVPAADPEYYRPDDLESLFTTAVGSVDEEGVRWPVRDLAMCSFLAVLGLRASELCNANLDWITKERLVEVDEAVNWVLHVRGKGRKLRHLPLSNELLAANRAWQLERSERFGNPGPDAPLFLTHDGCRFNYQRLRYWLRRLNQDAALRNRSLHALRHTAGIQLAYEGTPIHLIQKMLGHASVATTGIYTELADQELANVINYSATNELVGRALESP